MYNTRPGLLIGFHGCDKARQEKLLLNSLALPISEKPFLLRGFADCLLIV